MVALYVALWRGGREYSRDLNASIMHEVVLRYANMNYLTSSADLLLHHLVSMHRLTVSSILRPFL